MLELETLRELGGNANARIYIGFDKHALTGAEDAKQGLSPDNSSPSRLDAGFNSFGSVERAPPALWPENSPPNTSRARVPARLQAIRPAGRAMPTRRCVTGPLQTQAKQPSVPRFQPPKDSSLVNVCTCICKRSSACNNQFQIFNYQFPIGIPSEAPSAAPAQRDWKLTIENLLFVIGYKPPSPLRVPCTASDSSSGLMHSPPFARDRQPAITNTRLSMINSQSGSRPRRRPPLRLSGIGN